MCEDRSVSHLAPRHQHKNLSVERGTSHEKVAVELTGMCESRSFKKKLQFSLKEGVIHRQLLVYCGQYEEQTGRAPIVSPVRKAVGVSF